MADAMLPDATQPVAQVDQPECVICKADLDPSQEECTTLHCMHRIHTECWTTWVGDQHPHETECPTCKQTAVMLAQHLGHVEPNSSVTGIVSSAIAQPQTPATPHCVNSATPVYSPWPVSPTQSPLSAGALALHRIGCDGCRLCTVIGVDPAALVPALKSIPPAAVAPAVVTAPEAHQVVAPVVVVESAAPLTPDEARLEPPQAPVVVADAQLQLPPPVQTRLALGTNVAVSVQKKPVEPGLVYCDTCGDFVHFAKCRILRKSDSTWRCSGCRSSRLD